MTRNPIETGGELLDGAREAVARRLGGDWTAEALGWLADGGRHDRRR
jgi:hypothetical protein